MTATDYTRYHGGDPGNELTSLISLALGIQLRSGGQTRWFDIDGDQWGRPVEFDRDSPYLEPPHPHRRPLLPHIADEVLLEDATPTPERYPRISGPQAVGLVRAARSYQQALWIADDDPNLAWPHLVSAVETAAGQWGKERGTPEDILRDARPDIMDRLETSGDPTLIADVAGLVAPLFRSTARFMATHGRTELAPPPAEFQPVAPDAAGLRPRVAPPAPVVGQRHGDEQLPPKVSGRYGTCERMGHLLTPEARFVRQLLTWAPLRESPPSTLTLYPPGPLAASPR
jgi:hypothetical protein